MKEKIGAELATNGEEGSEKRETGNRRGVNEDEREGGEGEWLLSLLLTLIAGFQCHAIQIDENKNQNRSIDILQNLGNERR